MAHNCNIIFVKVSLLLLLIRSSSPAKKCELKDHTGEIIGGERAKEGQLPWQIFLINNERGTECGGSIITARHIITAGHCIRDESGNALTNPKNVEIYAGILDKNKLHADTNGQKKSARSFHLHPKHNVTYSIYEMVIIKLTSEFNWTDTVKPIRWANKKDKADLEGESVIVSGWGNTDFYGTEGTTSDHLKWATLIVAPCEPWVESPDLFCARGKNEESACSGDSGGPGICKDSNGKDYLCGFSSKSYCQRGQTKLGQINFYDDFIQQTIKN